MARKPRVEYDGAFYHVIARGNQRQKTFHDDQDRGAYLERLEHYHQRDGFRLYAYVLMSNHVHLLIETQSVPGIGVGLSIDLMFPSLLRVAPWRASLESSLTGRSINRSCAAIRGK